MPECDRYLSKIVFEIEDQVTKNNEDREEIVRRAINL